VFILDEKLQENYASQNCRFVLDAVNKQLQKRGCWTTPVAYIKAAVYLNPAGVESTLQIAR